MSCVRIYSYASFPSLTKPERTLKLTTFSSTFLGRRLPKSSLNVDAGVSKRQVCGTVCLFGGKGKASNDNESSPWKSLEKAMGNLKKEPSVEELLKQQIEKQEYYEEGGGDGDLPGGGGGDGGGSGGSDEPEGGWEPEDESDAAALKEIGQVLMAALGLVFAYWYILQGDEIRVYTKDIFKFILFRYKSVRLRRLIEEIEDFFQTLTEKNEERDPYWLERAIIRTPTWWDSPAIYRQKNKKRKPKPKPKSHSYYYWD